MLSFHSKMQLIKKIEIIKYVDGIFTHAVNVDTSTEFNYCNLLYIDRRRGSDVLMEFDFF